jgi:hypothetical protein
MRVLLLLSCACWALACSYGIDAHPTACGAEGQCPVGLRCYRGFCLDSSLVPESGAGACEDGAPPESCYDGPEQSAGHGACRAGKRFCVQGAFTECFDQVTPSPEICNGKDDDCNGEVDDVASESCDVALGGLCGAEGKVVCRDGVPSCELAAGVTVESCNGTDDDCDGETDEDTQGGCYPQTESGCTGDPAHGFRCSGLCAPGALACSDGVARCDGAITPAAERCTESGPALDEDCDGAVDETCGCEAGSTQPCHAGPEATLGQGACGVAGIQTCAGGVFGACTGQVLPEAETCANPGVDDDCDGTIDDVPAVGATCIDDTKLGNCKNGVLRCMPGSAAPVCVSEQPARELCDPIDQDCDGNPVNGFDLNSQSTCGACDVSCSDMQVCCDGGCLDRASLETDVEHCGACDVVCGSNQYCCQGRCLNQPEQMTMSMPAPGDVATAELTACDCAEDCGTKACCGTRCVDLIKDAHNCGACANVCGPDQECKGGICKRR